MSEEKKAGKEVKRLVYEEPRLVKLVNNTGLGECTAYGSGDSSTCWTGNVAGTNCDTGNSAVGNGCGGGNSPEPF